MENPYPGVEHVKYAVSLNNLTYHTSELPGPDLSAKVREASSCVPELYLYTLLCKLP